MPPKLKSKTTVESPNSRSDVAEAAQEGRVPTLVEQIENLMNSPVRQQGNPSNYPIEQVEEVQVMWTCLFFSLIILMNFRLSCKK